MPRIVFIIAFLILFSSFGFSQTIEQTQTADFSSKPIAILSTPKANYTDIARRKGVEGRVKLLVVFKADGSIGEITDITKKKRKKLEKYGLTAQAIEAAKKIRFSPAMQNGVPIDVAKVVEYGFDLY